LKVLDSAETNSVKWFGKTRARNVLEDTMKQFISPSVEKINGEWVPSGKYPPSLKMKVPVYDGRVAMDVTDSQGSRVEVTPENIAHVFPKRVDASVVVSPGIYVSGQGFGVTWRVSYAKVSPPQRTTAADIFRDEIEQEVNTATAVPIQQEETEVEEEEMSVPMMEETPTAPPAPAPMQKNRRRAAVA
jgi:hypothetical protein